MKRLVSFLLTASTLAVLPASYVDKFSLMDSLGSFVNKFRVQGIEYPYPVLKCLKSGTVDRKPGDRYCAGHVAQTKFRNTFLRVSN
jgi:hypothetical protein